MHFLKKNHQLLVSKSHCVSLPCQKKTDILPPLRLTKVNHTYSSIILGESKRRLLTALGTCEFLIQLLEKNLPSENIYEYPSCLNV